MKKCMITFCHNMQAPGSDLFCDRHEELWRASSEGLRARQVFQTAVADFAVRLNSEEFNRVGTAKRGNGHGKVA